MVLDIIFLALAILLLVGLVFTFFPKNKFIEKQSGNARKITRAILILIAGTFIHFGCMRTGRSFVDVYVFFESFYSAAKLFLADGTLEFGKTGHAMTSVLKYVYFSLYYLVCFIAISTSAYTVLSFFESFSNDLKLRRYAKRRNICIFNELNSKTILVAKSLLEENQPIDQENNSEFDFFSAHPSSKKAPLIIFCDVFKSNEEKSYELVSKAETLGAICYKKSVVEVHKKLCKLRVYRGSDKRLLRYYLFDQNEKTNVHHAIDIVKEETDEQINATNRFENLGIFVLAFGNSNGIMLESLNNIPKDKNEKNSYFVRRLNPAVMMAQHIFFDKKNYLVNAENPDKDLNILVVGMGRYGFEIIKTLSWFYQRKEGSIHIHVVDQNPNTQSFAAVCCPDLVWYQSSADKTEDSQFKIIFHKPCDVFSTEFKEILSSKEMSSLDAVSVSLGDDTLNAEAAIHIRTMLDQIHYLDIYQAEEKLSNPKCDTENSYIEFSKDHNIEDKVKIFAVIHNDENNLSFVGDDKFSSGKYNISFVGMDSELYSCENIYNFEIENKAIELHSKKKGVESAGAAINSYNCNESDRISSIARTQHKKLMEYLYGDKISEEDEIFKKVENKRWNAFTRSRGYILVDKSMTREVREKLFNEQRDSVKRKFSRGKWHNSLVPFEGKGTNEQNNNN